MDSNQKSSAQRGNNDDTRNGAPSKRIAANNDENQKQNVSTSNSTTAQADENLPVRVLTSGNITEQVDAFDSYVEAWDTDVLELTVGDTDLYFGDDAMEDESFYRPDSVLACEYDHESTDDTLLINLDPEEQEYLEKFDSIPPYPNNK